MTRVEVHLAFEALTPQRPTLVGHAFFTRNRGNISTTFTYNPDYLNAGGINIDPQLRLEAGAQYFPGLLGAFSDCSPDRWGRNLLDKAERLAAREEKRTQRHLDDLDYLLGVSDNTRQGALRFRLPHGDFLGAHSTVPPLISLPHLLLLADRVAEDENPHHALKALLDTGTTGLGGARPKASVLLKDNSLAIAKFPHSSDQWDVMAWEAFSLKILRQCGVNIPHFELTRVGERSVLLLQRFDRNTSGHRIPYISMMTAIGLRDGDHADYVDIADAIRDISCSPTRDLHELFDRTVLNILLGNTDDHLRNHGFIGSEKGWRLSPTFDVNPNPNISAHRSTSILGSDDIRGEAAALLSFADACNLTKDQALEHLSELLHRTEQWQAVAHSVGVTSRDMKLMEAAFNARRSCIRDHLNMELA